jgi:hypothetical protein
MSDKEEEKEAEEVKTLIKDVERDTTKYILGVLQTIINEQVKARDLDRQTGDYIYEAVREQAHRKGWIE